MGAALDIPVAWLNQQRSKIEARTKSLETVETAVAKSASEHILSDNHIAEQAFEALARKEYRRQSNKEAVGFAALEDIQEDHKEDSAINVGPAQEIDDDWLNVFERYAEDASSERMQKLWGRVLAGEIRRPGQFSTRTLRFLSEFSQGDALLFSSFCSNAFRDAAPRCLVKPEEMKDLRHLFALEDAGLIKGIDGVGLQLICTFNNQGSVAFVEKGLVLLLKGTPGEVLKIPVLTLTQLGQELLPLLPDRDARAAARAYAHAIRVPEIKSAILGRHDVSQAVLSPMEILWQEPPEVATPTRPVA